ncbi:MAG TPA: tetratricopeptide repeat protein [Xanthobacteraceae bacterium]|jgi:protein O-GlcNAc transferase|nr:tetratricopeptide repeat protein [Xanthobacteraceae bacterium]
MKLSSPANPIQELMALHATGRFAEMEVRARAAIKTASNSAILHELLGIALCAQQRFEEALGALRKAVVRQPQDAQFHENLALCQRHLKQYEAAAESLRKSLQLRPQSVETLAALGSVLRSLRRPEEAEMVLRQALALAPRHVQTLCVLGNVQCNLGNFVEAESCYRAALALDPANPFALANFGNVLASTGRHVEACGAADSAMKAIGTMSFNAAPEGCELALIAANVLAGAEQYVAAAQVYRQVFEARKSLADALSSYSTMRQVCAWEVTAETDAQCRNRRFSQDELDAISPFTSAMMMGITASQQLDVARNYAQRFGRPSVVSPARAAPGPARDRIRVGYVSGDLREHAFSRLTVPVFENHDRTRFEVFAYDYSPPAQDDLRRRVEGAFDHMVALHQLSDLAAAQRIAADACEIVVDGTGWTQRTRSQILRFRPAPVQVQWLGYPGTLGAPWCDYIVADKVLIRPGEEKFYAEKIIRMPFTYQPNGARDAVDDPGTRADHGLPDDALVFCSFNQGYKITPDIFDKWMQLLRQVETSVVWLLGFSEEMREALRREAEARGVSRERLVFAPFVPNDRHLARLALADLALDCFPYGSHTTASDVLWAGVPLIALTGDTFAARVSASILAAAGFGDLVAASLADYHDLALRYASDRRLLAALKARVSGCRSSPLFDSKRFARDLESAYAAVVERSRAGLRPDHIAIS